MTKSGIFWKTSDGGTFNNEEDARKNERFERVLKAICGHRIPDEAALKTADWIVEDALAIVKALRLTDGWPKEFNADGTERFYELVPHYRNGKFYNRKFYKGGEVLGFKQRKNE